MKEVLFWKLINYQIRQNIHYHQCKNVNGVKTDNTIDDKICKLGKYISSVPYFEDESLLFSHF